MKKLLLNFLLCSVVLSASEWNYKEQDKWHIIHGKHQSPINIDSSIAKNYDGKIWNNFESANVTNVLDNGHSIVANIDNAHSLIDNREFKLLQFHFHASSEHTLNNEYAPMEVHFVHQSESGRYAVLGVFLVEGRENESFSKILKLIDKNKSDKVDLTLLLPDNKTFYHYLGSLTTPPLVENVEWYVYETPVELSKKQIETFKKYYSDNFRELQNLEDRTILISE